MIQKDIKDYLITALTMACLLGQIGRGAVIAPSNPTVTTHSITYNNITLGITSYGGGAINQIIVGGTDLMGPNADMYGRMGQSSIRDRLHSDRYNPTQAGFNETLGTPSTIIANSSVMAIQSRPCALWHGDGLYDFTRWENIGADPYTNDNGNSDTDPIDEENLPGKQDAEVKSEFDYWGRYERVQGITYDIPIFRHMFTYSLVRGPSGECFRQFGPGATVLDPVNGSVTDISNTNPSGSHPDLTYYLSNISCSMAVRFDTDRSPFTVTRWIDNNGNWQMADRSGNWLNVVNVYNNQTLRNRTADDYGTGLESYGTPGKRLLILAQNQDIGGNKMAIGCYYPASGFNNTCIVGRNRSTGAVLYTDDRVYGAELRDSLRTSTLEWFGARFVATGMLHLVTLESLNAYEEFRGDVYFLFGNPTQIRQVCENDLWGL
ncbi:hypothetical protein [Tichowtungia aerotolerans]|uniref:Uncharacterized protein n=1 Tax=Tichowtungia aerotolerans TaxID=2697043 RepID=A0A6P1M856_9BACT|nr:hypothetical protein [Tichowtungia aerotolerans]QHI70067.1 hypothetical protein GT409_11630 [Tichowtungia aerotolerans]